MAWFPELAKLLKSGDDTVFDIPEGISEKQYYNEKVFDALQKDVKGLKNIKVANIPMDGVSVGLKPALKLLNMFTSGLTAYKILTTVGLTGLFTAVESGQKDGALLWCKKNPNQIEKGESAITTFAKGNDTKALPALFNLVKYLIATNQV